MTPEKAQYHLLMLRLGQRAEYDRELDRILEEEDPLPPLILDLALCMSDLNQTISLLREFLLDHPADQQTVYDMVPADLRRKYTEEKLTRMTCLPDSLQGKRYYVPGNHGNEKKAKEKLDKILAWKAAGPNTPDVPEK